MNALDRALRDAIGELHPQLAEIELVDYKVRILDSHHGTGAGHPRPARLHRRPETVGLDRRVGEHHRGLLGGAGGLARVRLPARRPTDSTTRPRSPGAIATGMTERIPLAKPVLGEREEELVLEVLRSGRLSLGPMQERFEREFADLPRRRATRSPSPPAPPRFTSASGRSAGARATRSSPRRSPSSPRPTACSTRARRRSSATSTR